ncbi:MAG: hypothetical protein ACJ79H_05185 [Myxococcales bacterium]
MKWKTLFAMMLAVGSSTATAARAQDDVPDAAATTSEAKTATSKPPAYGMDFNEPATIDADGIPVAKPNPMSRFLERSDQLGGGDVEAPLVDDWRTDAPATDGQAN